MPSKTPPAATSDPFVLLRIAARSCERLAYELEQRRAERDRLALALIEDGHTWREVAGVAGFANPYIAELKRRQRANA